MTRFSHLKPCRRQGAAYGGRATGEMRIAVECPPSTALTRTPRCSLPLSTRQIWTGVRIYHPDTVESWPDMLFMLSQVKPAIMPGPEPKCCLLILQHDQHTDVQSAMQAKLMTRSGKALSCVQGSALRTGKRATPTRTSHAATRGTISPSST